MLSETPPIRTTFYSWATTFFVGSGAHVPMKLVNTLSKVGLYASQLYDGVIQSFCQQIFLLALHCTCQSCKSVKLVATRAVMVFFG